MKINRLFLYSVVSLGFCVCASLPRAADIYLFYSASSADIAEIGLASAEAARAFDDHFGPASEELPSEVKYRDFYVAKFPDQSYAFILNAPFNCGQLGCNTFTYTRDAGGDLQMGDSAFPVKCKTFSGDKLLCVKGGYQPEKPVVPETKKRGPVHYPAPRPQ